MPQGLETLDYQLGLERQRDALSELAGHVDRLLCGLAWVTDDLAEVHTAVHTALVRAELEVAMPPDLPG